MERAQEIANHVSERTSTRSDLAPEFEAQRNFGNSSGSQAGRVIAKEDQKHMDPKIVIRSETDADASAIGEVTVAAFETLEISSHTEQFIVEALRGAGALTVSLVAELDGRTIGHIAFSPVTISDGTRDWYGLGPVSVLRAFQRQGIGEALIREGLARLKEMGARGCCLMGHPAYYPRFGFINPSGLAHEGVPPEAFFALSFDGHYPQGTVTFHEGFRADGSKEDGGTGDGATHAVQEPGERMAGSC